MSSKENVGVLHTDMKGKASNPMAMDPTLHSSDNTWGSMQSILAESGDDSLTFFAAHLANDSGSDGYYGLVATMDVYGFNLNGGQLSKAAIWISNDEGDWRQNLNTITAGWLSDAYRNTGCLNTDCPGFQLASVQSPPMGSGAFAPSDKASSFWNIQFLNEDGSSTPIDHDLLAIISDESSYSVSIIDGARFTYGGPGGKSA
ncbi:hypothetical protein PR202_gb29892 [Eleusine coracana subsp. coracana]|uniref:Neprosin PEP catalytic domain-containing protein n=1 Tax=Eleusine coracana subsp. coracana TaxID=191504 RepID=A0AAV5G1R6_ELECO|nr:hypothetical protein PR202_gb29892 [Eleusine coracana subsp. coracana]